LENKLGGGGGFVHVFYGEENTHFIFVHLGLPSRKVYLKQLSFLQSYLRKLDGKVILFGDFNLSFLRLETFFSDYNLVSGGVKTCSNTPVMKWFYNRDVDHIFVKGFELIKCGTLCGKSDHKLIYTDLK
jgi:endonuclease/exonuclease/phosphatase (EEP) superfamily protein YafD